MDLKRPNKIITHILCIAFLTYLELDIYVSFILLSLGPPGATQKVFTAEGKIAASIILMVIPILLLLILIKRVLLIYKQKLDKINYFLELAYLCLGLVIGIGLLVFTYGIIKYSIVPYIIGGLSNIFNWQDYEPLMMIFLV